VRDRLDLGLSYVAVVLAAPWLFAAFLVGGDEYKARRKAIFVHGCFWHRHEGCLLARLPKSRLAFWESKLEANRVRDEKTLARLGLEGWSVLVVWECELRDVDTLAQRIATFMAGER